MAFYIGFPDNIDTFGSGAVVYFRLEIKYSNHFSIYVIYINYIDTTNSFYSYPFKPCHSLVVSKNYSKDNAFYVTGNKIFEKLLKNIL
jgi:hypothetical protein